MLKTLSASTEIMPGPWNNPIAFDNGTYQTKKASDPESGFSLHVSIWELGGDVLLLLVSFMVVDIFLYINNQFSYTKIYLLRLANDLLISKEINSNYWYQKKGIRTFDIKSSNSCYQEVDFLISQNKSLVSGTNLYRSGIVLFIKQATISCYKYSSYQE